MSSPFLACALPSPQQQIVLQLNLLTGAAAALVSNLSGGRWNLFGLELGAWREMDLGLVVLTEKQAGGEQGKALKSLNGNPEFCGGALGGYGRLFLAGDWRGSSDAAFPWERSACNKPSESRPGPGPQGEAGPGRGQIAPRARLPGSWLGKWEMVVPFLEVREHGEHSKFNFENLLLYFFLLSDLLVYQN